MSVAGKQAMGTLEQADGRWRLRFTRPLDHPPEKVWRAITEPAHLRAWFPQRITGEWVVGAALTFSQTEGPGPGFGGEVLACVPPALLEFRWGTDVIRLEVEPRPGGSTLTLLDTIDDLGTAARTAAGWHECLDQLGSYLDGRPPSPPGERWLEVHADYVGSFGPEAAAVGPPPGYDPRARRSAAGGGRS
jgi:uncharacterized protein YndB with AHSA1/START domain